MTPEEMDQLRRQLAENTRITQEILTRIIGNKEVRSQGIVDELSAMTAKIGVLSDTVAKHERYVIWGGGCFATLLFVWELYKAVVLKVS